MIKNEGDILNTKELLKFFKISMATLYKWREMRMPFIKCSHKMVRYSKSDITEWLKKEMGVNYETAETVGHETPETEV